MTLTPRQVLVTTIALKDYIKTLEAELSTTSDVSYAWSLLIQAREDAHNALGALQGE